MIYHRFDHSLKYISGGNSTSYTLIYDKMFPETVNHLRIGDTFYFGRDMSRRTYIEGMQHDCFVLSCEIVEIKEKPSVPIGTQGYAALNTKPSFEDKGIRRRAICSVGRQDIDLDIIPHDSDIHVLGASSDHLLLDITDCDTNYKIGIFSHSICFILQPCELLQVIC
jgi:predicted amino acid racemase